MSLWLILDAAVIAIYILAVIFFRKKGFLKASETIISLILTVCLMSTALPLFEEAITKSSIGESVISGVTEFLVPEQTEEETEKKSALPDFLQSAVDKNLEKLDEAKNDMMQATADQTSKVILQAISVILLFILVKLAIFLLFRFLELICHIKLMRFVNRTLGLILGVINGTIIIYLLCAVTAVFLPAEYAMPIKEAMDKTYLAQLFYNNNLLMQIFI